MKFGPHTATKPRRPPALQYGGSNNSDPCPCEVWSCLVMYYRRYDPHGGPVLDSWKRILARLRNDAISSPTCPPGIPLRAAGANGLRTGASRHHGWRAPPEAIFFKMPLSNHTNPAKSAPKGGSTGPRETGQNRWRLFILTVYCRFIAVFP